MQTLGSVRNCGSVCLLRGEYDQIVTISAMMSDFFRFWAMSAHVWQVRPNLADAVDPRRSGPALREISASFADTDLVWTGCSTLQGRWRRVASTVSQKVEKEVE